MDLKRALLKGSKEIPSLSLKINHRQPRHETNPQHILQDTKAEENNRDWLDLPPDVMLSILQRIHWYDVVMNAKKVCKYWLTLCKDPSLCRVIDIRDDILLWKLWEKKNSLQYNKARPTDQELEKFYHKMTMLVVDFSGTRLLDLCIQNHGSDYLLQYIYHRSSRLKCLRLEDCIVRDDYNPYISSQGLIQMLRNLPLLEELHLFDTRISREGIEVAGCCCPHLKSFTMTTRQKFYISTQECDEQALAISENMPGLQYLQLFGNRMTITGLMAILNNCHYLEYLDLRQCYSLCEALEDPSFERKLPKHIKHVRFPRESTKDYERDCWIDFSDGLTDDEFDCWESTKGYELDCWIDFSDGLTDDEFDCWIEDFGGLTHDNDYFD